MNLLAVRLTAGFRSLEHMLHSNDPFLHFEIEQGLSRKLAVGPGSAVFVGGWCFHRRLPITRMWLRVGGRAIRVRSHSMPRPDVLRAHGTDVDPHRHSFWSGFWAVLPLPASWAGHAELELVTRLRNGHLSSMPFGTVEIVPGGVAEEPDNDVPADDALVAVCVATQDPDPALFRRQVESLRAQTHPNWVCVISDDSRPDVRAAIKAELVGDSRFRVTGREAQSDGYDNVHRALMLVPEDAELIAVANQGDRWYPERIERLRSALDSRTTLVHSDARIVTPTGRELSETYWKSRRRNDRSLMSLLLLANAESTPSPLFRRGLLDLALPFPPQVGEQSADHWLATVACATGRIGYVDQPLHDCVRDAEDAGPAFRGPAPDTSLPQGRSPRAWAGRTLRRWRADYFHRVCAMQLQATVLLLRAEASMQGRKRRTARIIRVSQRTVGALVLACWLWVRAIGARLRRSPTMGLERRASFGFAWRLWIRFLSRIRRRSREGLGLVAAPSPPPTQRDVEPPPEQGTADGADVNDRGRLELAVSEGAERRVNVLIAAGELDAGAGRSANLQLARRLTASGARVRVVAVEDAEPGRAMRAGRPDPNRNPTMAGLEVVFARAGDGEPLEVSPADRFLATSAWAAALASQATSELRRRTSSQGTLA